MRISPAGLGHLPALLAAATALAVGGSLVAPTGGYAATADVKAIASARVKPAVPGSTYLALGDSVAFGYRESTNLPTPDYTKPASFRGYPEEVAASLGLKLTNAACPGETTSSFISKTAPSNGCENFYSPGVGQVTGGYRVSYPLHVAYGRAQLAFAEHFLTTHPNTRLVTLTLGANDAFLCQASTSDGCANEVGTLIQTLTGNLTTILKGLRATGYAGQIVMVPYYSLDYGDAALSNEVQFINSIIAGAARPYRVRTAPVYDAFAAAAAQANGSVCTAQLVTALTTGSCGIHPSVSGTAVLAQAVEQKVKK